MGAGAGFSYDFDVVEFAKRYQLDVVKTLNCLKLLEEEGYFFVTEAVYLSPRVKVTADRQTLYKFAVENRKLEPLLKLILRTYEGAFDHYVKINERLLAREMQLKVGEVQEYMKKMDRLQVLNYEPQKEKPQLTFLTPRLEDQNVHLDIQLLKARKKANLDRVLAMQNYVTNKVLCRSRFLLHYFGDKETVPCGMCDICTGRHRTEVTDEEYERIASYFNTVLAANALPVKDLLKNSPLKHEEKVINVLRSWMDEGKLLLQNGELVVLAKRGRESI